MDWKVLRAYVDHFLPREVIGPVVIVFSLEGVVDGLFNLYVPDGYETLGWAVVFLLSLALIAYWGATDEEAREELDDRIEEIQTEADTEESP
ncbi:hypothetical protein [Salinibaculum rarum]|uniref:hypothetical protein n=1 Tax=Salinibaculum rarum TaxID=3058903 RepID=UPI00265F8EB6|nr:hypothetical protein [Salinibaculum sp. KK48]